ncbi:hypothetical protein [Actinoplanes subglobosus]|uniref:Uncharacterized protein n=1 Tax=Actinoplanes subglobosus TaxID=1547892 RepID=A0ABV8J4H2_9ACTN
MTDTERFLTFEHGHRDGLHSYTVTVGESDLTGRVWPGLAERGNYPDDPDLNPWHRHAINNQDGEPLAVWRALTWALAEGRSRHVIPSFLRDEVASCLGVDREDMLMVRWEYQVDIELADRGLADYGFVPARTSKLLRSGPDTWDRDHIGFAGLFEVNRFRQLVDIDRVLAGDNASELTVFGLRDPGRRGVLVAALSRDERPELAAVLEPGEIFVDMAVIRESGAGISNHLTVKAPEAIPQVERLADHFSRAFRRYRDRAGRIHTLNDFHAAIDDLLAPPDRT